MLNRLSKLVRVVLSEAETDTCRLVESLNGLGQLKVSKEGTQIVIPLAVLLSPFQARGLTSRPAKYEQKTELWMSGVNELALAPPVDDSNAGKVRTGASQHKKAKIHRHPFRDSHK